MTKKNLSIHLQNFPDVSFIKDEKQLVADMDLIQNICSTALFIRDQQNLRVRLPLNKLTIIGNVNPTIAEHKAIIADEVNVKNIEISDKLTEFADLRLQINFKKVGARFGQKMKEIAAASKQGNWTKSLDETSNLAQIEICGELLKEADDEFEIKLVPKDQTNTAALPSNDCVVQLDTQITEELRAEGIARDVIRYVQEKRKQAGFDISDKIIISLNVTQAVAQAVNAHKDLIAENTLAEDVKVVIDDNADELSEDSFTLTNLSNSYKEAKA
ncbi:MAG: DUF5915 domain-containing protein [Proteobacteria bacterium]|nr:DUF5915 domain-containing protein [Pseudomonadota bacterium]